MAYQYNGERAWWKEGIIYQVYPRSFKDSNGDGIGDIPGIVSKLDYLAGLGIDMIWINPVYASPNDDNGYDISNYHEIMPEFGTMADFDALLQGLHQRGIRLVLDLVLNHTSDEHPWFRQAKQSRDNPYYPFYHWWPAEKGKPPYRYSFFDANGDAWTYNAATDSWYLHYFSARMPDLNWEHPPLRQEMYRMMRWWFNKGVDGFRLDAIPYISKDTTWPLIPAEVIKSRYRNDWSYYYSQGPHLHQYLQEMRREAMDGYDVTTIAEAPGTRKEEALLFVQESRKELHMLYHFEGMQLGYAKGAFKRPDPKGFDLLRFKDVYTSWDQVFEREGWGTVYLGNHDQPRMVTRWGNDSPQYREVSAKMLITFLLTMRATPIFYNGDELGMTNIRFEKIEDYRDIETRSMYEYIKKKKGDLQRFLKDQQFGARDNSRTPFQWDDSPNAGFTEGQPWLKVNGNYTYLNAAAQEKDPHSVLQYFRQLVRLRKQRLALVYGHYEIRDPKHVKVYAYTRTLDDERCLVILNFSGEQIVYRVPDGLQVKMPPLANNVKELQMQENNLLLQPYQALVFECEQQH